ncbi:MAG TPA: VOC family protein [Mycobacteriales bacterium]|nr:VOC family protein [Mycobacteriales bacterium]
MATGVQVVFDCANPSKLATFWATVLGYMLEPPPPGFATWEEWAQQAGIPEEMWDGYAAVVDPDGVGPRLFFQRVPEPKTVKNRVHLDVNVGGGRGTPKEERRSRVYAAADRLTAAGATRLYEHDDMTGFAVTMTDPEGNEFCLQ